MKTFFKIFIGFILLTIVIILIGGGGAYLTTITDSFMTRYIGLAENSYWATVLLALIFVGVAILLIPFVLLFTTKFKQPVVFISFKHIHEEKAIDLEHQLIEAGLGVERLAFSSNYSHDEVISQVRMKLRKSDVVVTIPDSAKASFVDSELLAASALRLPIVLIRYQEKQSQPGTLLLGYPVFDYQCIQKNQFKPLFRFLFFATRSYRGFFNQTKRILKQMFDPYLLAVLGAIIAIFLVLKFLIQAVRWLLLDVLNWSIGQFFMENDEMFKSVIIMLILGFTVYSIGKAFYILRVARQVIVTGKDSYEMFREEFSYLKEDKEMLECIQVNSLVAKGK